METLFDYAPDARVVLDHEAEQAVVARFELIGEFYEARREMMPTTVRDANDETLSPLKRALLGCEMILRLDDDKKQVQDFVASKMEMIAPNMSRYRRVF